MKEISEPLTVTSPSGTSLTFCAGMSIVPRHVEPDWASTTVIASSLPGTLIAPSHRPAKDGAVCAAGWPTENAWAARRMPSRAVHRSVLDEIPLVMRLLVSCGRIMHGGAQRVNERNEKSPDDAVRHHEPLPCAMIDPRRPQRADKPHMLRAEGAAA